MIQAFQNFEKKMLLSFDSNLILYALIKKIIFRFIFLQFNCLFVFVIMVFFFYHGCFLEEILLCYQVSHSIYLKGIGLSLLQFDFFSFESSSIFGKTRLILAFS